MSDTHESDDGLMTAEVSKALDCLPIGHRIKALQAALRKAQEQRIDDLARAMVREAIEEETAALTAKLRSTRSVELVSAVQVPVAGTKWQCAPHTDQFVVQKTVDMDRGVIDLDFDTMDFFQFSSRFFSTRTLSKTSKRIIALSGTLDDGYASTQCVEYNDTHPGSCRQYLQGSAEVYVYSIAV